MNAIVPPTVSRRSVLVGAGSLVLSFSTASGAFAQTAETPAGGKPKLPGSLSVDPYLDAWIKVEPDGAVTVFTGKAELGQGIRTALLQVAAEELDLPLGRLKLITADTGLTANEGYTAGSHSMQDSGTAIRHAAAQVREILVGEASRRLGVTPDQLHVEQGVVLGPNDAKLSYGDLVATDMFHAEAQPTSRLKAPGAFKIMGTSVPRVDIPAKVTGGAAYVQDMRLPGMVHARRVMPPSYGGRLDSFDSGAVESMPGFVKLVRDGNFLAVLFEREYQAIKGMRVLAASARWTETPSLPDQANLPKMVLGLASRDITILDKPAAAPAAPAATVTATYTRPYQGHGSIGPSCAVAHLTDDGLVTVWTHTQGVYPDRKAIAELLHKPLDKVRCIHTQGSGCYGHNGADDAAADAALLAVALPSRPVRVQWMREQENAWEPFGPAMVTRLGATLDASGKIADLTFDVWSNTHATRPGNAGSLLAGQHVAKPFTPPAPEPAPQPEGAGDRNAIPLYALPSARVVNHFLPDMPLRVSAMRSLGAYMNIFSLESFMDEAALAAKADPVAFRLAHLEDERARAVIRKAAEMFGWDHRPGGGNGAGSGFAFARYKNLAAYCAIALHVDVEHETGRVRIGRVVAAVDAGQVVNPDGLRNQVEGAILQSASWTLFENVTFDRTRITSVDWSTYPIMRFHDVPERVEVAIIDRPGTPFLGAGECGQGPTGAAIANAIHDAVGQRLRDIPLTAPRVKAAIGV